MNNSSLSKAPQNGEVKSYTDFFWHPESIAESQEIQQ